MNRLGPNLVWDFTWSQRRFINSQNLKKLSPKIFWFLVNLGNSRTIIIKSANFLFALVYIANTKRKCSQRETQLKVGKEDGREAPEMPSILKSIYLSIYYYVSIFLSFFCSIVFYNISCSKTVTYISIYLSKCIVSSKIIFYCTILNLE